MWVIPDRMFVVLVNLGRSVLMLDRIPMVLGVILVISVRMLVIVDRTRVSLDKVLISLVMLDRMF